MDTILLVEDDAFTRHLMKERLERHDMVVLDAISGRRSLEILKLFPVDIILLDLGLPDANGLDLIKDMRHYSDAPLIIVSADQHIVSRITGLEQGADDFVPKPFSTEELLARIRANLRRYREPRPNGNSQESATISSAKTRFGDWVMDHAKFQIYDQSGKPGNLTSGEFRILAALVENAGTVLKRDDLCQAIKVDNYTPTARAIDVKIARIRKKIGDRASPPQIIKTVHGVGYLFDLDKIRKD